MYIIYKLTLSISLIWFLSWIVKCFLFSSSFRSLISPSWPFLWCSPKYLQYEIIESLQLNHLPEIIKVFDILECFSKLSDHDYVFIFRITDKKSMNQPSMTLLLYTIFLFFSMTSNLFSFMISIRSCFFVVCTMIISTSFGSKMSKTSFKSLTCIKSLILLKILISLPLSLL